MLTKMLHFFTAFTLLIMTLSSFADEKLNAEVEAENPIPIVANEEGVAIEGYDPVAYFTEKRALRGIPEHSCEWQGKTWFFSSEKNRDQFLSEPERYAPQYGGHCASAIVDGKLVNASPVKWATHNNKLYFYQNDRQRKKWFKDIDRNVSRSNKVWEKNILNLKF